MLDSDRKRARRNRQDVEASLHIFVVGLLLVAAFCFYMVATSG